MDTFPFSSDDSSFPIGHKDGWWGAFTGFFDITLSLWPGQVNRAHEML